MEIYIAVDEKESDPPEKLGIQGELFGPPFPNGSGEQTTSDKEKLERLAKGQAPSIRGFFRQDR